MLSVGDIDHNTSKKRGIDREKQKKGRLSSSSEPRKVSRFDLDLRSSQGEMISKFIESLALEKRDRRIAGVPSAQQAVLL